MRKETPLSETFETWLEKNGINTDASRKCYLRGDPYPANSFSYFELAANFMINGEPSFAFTVLDDWYEEIISSTVNVSNRKSYWAKTYQFFLTKQAELMASNQSPTIKPELLRDIRRKFAAEIKSKQSDRQTLAQLDGMNHLITLLGEDSFIKLAIESSYFFNAEIVKKRFEEIAEVFTTGGELPARKSSTPSIYSNVKIIEKKNGNSDVCSLIKKEFGYDLNQGVEKKPILNTIISHVWGKAIDPQYFTALWNIVLIPAWANHLMDKESAPEGSLASKLQSTIKAICLKLYNMQSFDWSKLPIGSCPQVAQAKDICHATYNIQVIQPSVPASGTKLGRITIKPITI
ncbi:MAG: hypothetical protein K2M85_06300 [Paramuribaculum sp.]|nr:hypothetical protein [Paramuribaculum sp.]